LGFFKYFNFFNDNVRALAELLHWNYPAGALAIVLPIGLSFHIFQSLSYTIEVYRGNQQPERHLGIFALYVMFYPQLVAGPIERPQNLLHQFHEPKHFDADRVSAGIQRMLWGLFKKIVIADRSGYSDIALGAAQVMGFTLIENFRRPYGAASIREFWTRWHISLSTWFKDYLYIPMGGNRVPKWRWSLNLVVVFLASGLWHGANWTFVVWGFLHGGYMVVGLWTQPLRARLAEWSGIGRWPRLQRAWQVGVTFSLVCFAWIFFRASSLPDAWYIATHLGQGLAHQLTNAATLKAAVKPLGSPTQLIIAIIVVALMEAVHLLQARGSVRELLKRQPVWVRWPAYQVLILLIFMFGVYVNQAFIYFQF
jgi:D-alanyl-lipoteichoic acid acyltransferase DltB (MBOAT superfamily)